ncbi:unnamed protein product [Rotaria magnacalcarata]|uniref:F-box domain-containing protein n=1 Tax=Rotaria magnacalcarata TaxID=392030 RepID=A0A819YFR9_9BILA|nr:unnamed protein product [Rotaria magnacalcarata]CAF2074047.1 unnamed protein product [Rotaria magnacalcarata]CAF4121897.1 unnamed protein product [Rotaria magnacalcarata]CAF4156801.1 unnamed protein product [Rotaria magnacalcarata]
MKRRPIISDDSIMNKRIKPVNESHRSKPRTTFEDLPNEMFYEIFDYLDAGHLFKSFSYLNTRLQNILRNSSLLLKVNTSSMSKSDLQKYKRDIILPYKHRITSLTTSNPFTVDIIFFPVRLASQFTRLKAIILDNIKSKYLCNILKHLASLHNLSSLVLIPIDHYRNTIEIYQCIFRLPVLKYCKISLKTDYYTDSLPIATNVTSPIEHLVIQHHFNLKDLNALLSYVPHLRHLKFHSFNGSYSNKQEIFSCSSSNLTHLSINLNSVSFDQFEFMTKTLFHQLDSIHISVDADRTYLDAKRWENLILSFMPRLRVFNFQHIDVIKNITVDIQSIHEPLLKQFESSFWSQRKWFFHYQFYSAAYQKEVIFYSINPFRRKKYTISRQLTECVPPRHQKTNMDAVDHVEIQGEKAIMKCVNYFRNATKLTLSQCFGESNFWLRINLKPILPVKRLTTLVLNCDVFRLDQLIELLRLAPHVHTLTINLSSIKDSNPISFQHNEAFQFVAKTNKITNVTIQEKSTLENSQLYIALCPRMQHLAIESYFGCAAPIIQYILRENKTNIQQLCSIRIETMRRSISKALQTVIESEKKFDYYSMKLIDYNLYLWW